MSTPSKNTFLGLNIGSDIVDGVTAFDLESKCLCYRSFHEDHLLGFLLTRHRKDELETEVAKSNII